MNNRVKFYRFVLGFVVAGKTIKMILIIHDPFICKFFYRICQSIFVKQLKISNGLGKWQF